PGAAENPLHLEVEQPGIGVDATMHATGLDQLGDLVSVAHRNSLQGLQSFLPPHPEERAASSTRITASRARVSKEGGGRSRLMLRDAHLRWAPQHEAVTMFSLGPLQSTPPRGARSAARPC